MKKYIFLGSVMTLTPVLTFAGGGIEDVLDTFSGLMGTLMPILISLAVIFFIFSLLMYILREGEEKAKAKTQMIWGIVILFVMISVWGLVGVLGDTFNLDNDAPTDTEGLLPTS
ncbi:MAG: hypothetical protein U9P50_02260 [Patescibacteria group bacterium]|nr:hypothetical protein [Patescibacteria group bacterium]